MRSLTEVLSQFGNDLRGFDWSELRYAAACGCWPAAVYVVMCIGAVLSLLLISGVVFLPGMSASWHAAQARSAALANEQTALVSQLATSSARNLSVVSRCVLCADLHARLLPADPMPVVLDHISSVAAAREIPVSVLRPEKVWQQSSRQAFAVDLHIQADTEQLTALLSDLAALPYALAVTQLDWLLTASTARLVLFLLVDSQVEGPRTHALDAARADLVSRAIDTTGKVDAGQESMAVDANWQRVALIQRGNRFLEVLRDAHGETRHHVGRKPEGKP